MSHLAPPSPAKRRLELVGGVTLALLGVGVAVIAVVALGHPKGRSAGTPRPAPVTSSSVHASARPKPTRTTASPSKTTRPTTGPATGATSPVKATRPPVLVLSSSNVDGLGALAAGRFKSGGWTATDGGKLTAEILSTAAYYDPAVSGARASALLLQAQFPAIARVVPRFDGLPAGPIVVVLTSGYS